MRRFLCVTLLFHGCEGLIAVPPLVGSPAQPSDPTQPGDPTTPPVEPCSTPSCDEPALTPRAVRLTHTQWERAVHQLFALPQQQNFSQRFKTDPTGAGTFTNNSTQLSVSSDLFQDYQSAAEAVATAVTQNDAALTTWLPSSLLTGSVAQRAETFIRRVGREVMRRPLSQPEVDAYQALFAKGPQQTAESDPFRAGVRLVLQAMLQSPDFLYRLEWGISPDGVAPAPLSDFELASRLSFALTDSPPDRTLLDAAEVGLHDPARLAAQVDRLWEMPAMRDQVLAFHAQLWSFDRIAYTQKDSTRFPGLPSGLPVTLRAEAEQKVLHTLLDAREGLAELLASPVAFVNRDTAPLYGVPGTFTTTLSRVSLDPTQRAGFLTQLPWLASEATPYDIDTIHRGAFLNFRVICSAVGSPPPNVPPLSATAPGRTNRERVDAHTAAPACAGCHHRFINPAGFAFEGYDAVGRVRSADNGFPIDASGTLPLRDGQAVTFASGVELSRKLATAVQTHRCYSGFWVEYVLGVVPQTGQRSLVERLAKRSATTGSSLKELLTELVTSPAFLTRNRGELP